MPRDTAHPAGSFLWRNLPNTISLTRLLATPILLYAVLRQDRDLFKWLLLACLLSDILDGLIARVFHLRSRVGAFLDSTADILVLILEAAGVIVFQKEFLAAHLKEVAVLVALFFAQGVAALWRYGRISSFHTILSRIAGYAQGIFVISLFLWGYQGWMFHIILGVAILAYSEEFVLLYLLPEWQSDVRGLYWVLSQRGRAPE